MRLVFFADNSTNPEGIHAFGNNDWHLSAAPEYWYYYQQGNEKYPTTTGLSVQDISEVLIYSRGTEEPVRLPVTPRAAIPTKAGVTPVTIVGSLVTCGVLGSLLHKRG
jgi:hypothetical protein